MGYKFLFYINDDLFFEANVQCMQCKGKSKNGNRCKRRVCIGTPFCWQHLASEKKLKIKESNIPNAGKGLFAWNPKNPNDVIFKRARATRFQNTPGQKIIEYAGELIDEEELNERYSNQTAPYGIEINNDRYEDAALIRGIGAIANHSRRNNARFDVSRNRIILRATKNIKHNEEILVNYGRNYRFDEDNFHETKYVR